MDFGLILGVLEQGLKLWNSKESSKYLDKTIKLRKEWYEEYSKPIETRDHNKLDDLWLELRLISAAFIKAAGTPNPVD
jgi:hypothetical protein